MKVIKNLLALIGAVTVGVLAYAAYQVTTGEATVETEDEDDYDDITLTLQHKKTEAPSKETESKENTSAEGTPEYVQVPSEEPVVETEAEPEEKKEPEAEATPEVSQ